MTDRPDYVRKNRASWDRISDTYHCEATGDQTGPEALAWGLWRIPESELHVLGDLQDKDVLDLGCGTGRWSLALAQAGARPVGLDISPRQLNHARSLMTRAGLEYPLIEASAEHIPLADLSFDIVISNWGAMTFCDPARTVPEAARVLRPYGLFAFATHSPVSILCFDRDQDTVGPYLVNDYFGMRVFESDDGVDFQITYGEWIRLFRENGFLIEDLLETRPALGATSAHRTAAETEWSRHWPMECIWRVRKTPARNPTS
jgi:SAM-dependent methyltransferase